MTADVAVEETVTAEVTVERLFEFALGAVAAVVVVIVAVAVEVVDA